MLVDVDGSLRWASASDQRAPILEDNQEVFAAGPCAQAFTIGKPAVMHDATLERRWDEIALTFVEVQIRSGLSVPVEPGGGPIRTLDVYAVDPRGWDPSEVAALQAYAALVGNLLAAAAKAELSGRKLTEVAREVAAGKPLPHERARPTPTQTEKSSSDAETPQPNA
jgi:GAF domain-containing protein